MTAARIEEMIRAALRAAVREAKADPQFLQRIARVICEELGADPMIGAYLASRLAKGGRDE